MHHQAAQEGAKLLKYLTVMRIDMAVILQILTGTRGGHAVINTVKPHRDAYHHRDDRQRVQKADRKAAARQNASERTIFDGMLSSRRVKINSSSCFIK